MFSDRRRYPIKKDTSPLFSRTQFRRYISKLIERFSLAHHGESALGNFPQVYTKYIVYNNKDLFTPLVQRNSPTDFTMNLERIAGKISCTTHDILPVFYREGHLLENFHRKLWAITVDFVKNLTPGPHSFRGHQSSAIRNSYVYTRLQHDSGRYYGPL